MKLSNYFIILISIILGFCIDTFINQFTVQLFIELNFGFLIFSYWIFAMPERFHSFIPLIYGLVIDLFFSTAVGLNMLFFVATSYVIHLYVFRFRIFSYFQLSVFFAGSSVFYIACKYLLLSPLNYSYILLIMSFLTNAILWVGIYFVMRSFRRYIFQVT